MYDSTVNHPSVISYRSQVEWERREEKGKGKGKRKGKKKSRERKQRGRVVAVLKLLLARQKSAQNVQCAHLAGRTPVCEVSISVPKE